jgi:ribA/ribD-fused uncharacterized protein
MSNTKIDSFRGPYRWLSNFAPVDVELDGVVYPSTEHAYQAAKTLDPVEREGIRALATPGQTKRAARQLTERADWTAVKEAVMLDLTRQKYAREPYRGLLLATGQCEIEEGNTWGDVFWGVCRGKGQNKLGQIIMQVRLEIRQGGA